MERGNIIWMIWKSDLEKWEQGWDREGARRQLLKLKLGQRASQFHFIWIQLVRRAKFVLKLWQRDIVTIDTMLQCYMLIQILRNMWWVAWCWHVDFLGAPNTALRVTFCMTSSITMSACSCDHIRWYLNTKVIHYMWSMLWCTHVYLSEDQIRQML